MARFHQLNLRRRWHKSDEDVLQLLSRETNYVWFIHSWFITRDYSLYLHGCTFKKRIWRITCVQKNLIMHFCISPAWKHENTWIKPSLFLLLIWVSNILQLWVMGARQLANHFPAETHNSNTKILTHTQTTSTEATCKNAESRVKIVNVGAESASTCWLSSTSYFWDIFCSSARSPCKCQNVNPPYSSDKLYLHLCYRERTSGVSAPHFPQFTCQSKSVGANVSCFCYILFLI